MGLDDPSPAILDLLFKVYSEPLADLVISRTLTFMKNSQLIFHIFYTTLSNPQRFTKFFL